MFLFRRDMARRALEALSAGDVSGTARVTAERNEELVANQLERLKADGRLACEAGCSHCCNLDVSLSTPELAWLVEQLREKLSAEQLAGVRERLEKPPEGGWCALLKDGRCLGYEARPLACRGWNSADAEPCRLASLNPDAPPAVPVNARLRGTSVELAEGLRDAVREQGLDDSQLDLQAGLRGLLAAETDVIAAWLAGEPMPEDWREEVTEQRYKG